MAYCIEIQLVFFDLVTEYSFYSYLIQIGYECIFIVQILSTEYSL